LNAWTKKTNVILIGTISCIVEKKRTQFGLANLGRALVWENHEGHPSSAPCSFSAPCGFLKRELDGITPTLIFPSLSSQCKSKA